MKNITMFSLALAFLANLQAYAQDHVTVYRDCDYRGSSHNLYEGEYRDNDLGVGNDAISAIRIPRGWRVTVFTDNNFRGTSRTFDESISCMPADINDEISSIRVSRTGYSGGGNSGGSGVITLYVDCNYRGGSHSLGLGRHNADDLGIGNDRLSAIRIPRGYRVTVYTDNYQRGTRQTFDENVSCLAADLNDKVSSILVERGSNSGSNRPAAGGSGTVTLYRDCNFRGASIRLGVGYHSDRDLAGIGNDQLSSLRVPRGYAVILYTDNNRGGFSVTYEENVSCLPSMINDKVSSVEIRRL